MNLIDLIPGGRVVQMIVLAALAAAVIGGVTWAVHSYNDGLRDEGRAEVQAKWDADKAERARVAIDTGNEYRRIEAKRVSNQADAEQRKTHEIAALNDRVAGLVGELRNRPERPAAGSGAASNPAAGKACTGAELYRPDAEFLVREAARAQRILAERDACHDKYNALTVTP